VWASVFNLFVVSVFWSFMADIFSNQQARRLFGLIAAGGTCGALAGPVITTALAVPLGATNLLPISALCLLWAVLCVHRLGAWSARQAGTLPGAQADQTASPMGGRLLDGVRLVLRSPYLLGICVLMLLFTTLSTFLYFQQAQIIADRFADSDQRTSVFAAIDLAVNGLTILLQILVTGRLVKAVGLAATLALVPLMLAVGFVALGLAPVLAVLVAVQVVRRAGNYAIMRPAREMLFVVVGREEKYKAKNFIDTVVYRGGDAVSAWCYAGLQALGFGLAQIAWLAVPLALLWGRLGHGLGRRQTHMAQSRGRAE
jgi:AAA family ATP:ADP antiporter